MLYPSKKARGFGLRAIDTGTVTVIELAGNSEKDEGASAKVAALRDELRARGRTRQVITGGDALAWVTADLVAMLAGEAASYRHVQGDVVFADLPEPVTDLLEDLGYGDVFGYFPTVADAVAALETGGKLVPVRDEPLGIKARAHRSSGIAVLELSGAIDERTAPAFVKAARALLEKKGFVRVVVDGSDLVAMTEDGPALLMKLKQECEKRGGGLALASFWGFPALMLRTLGLEDVLGAHPDLDSAHAALAARS